MPEGNGIDHTHGSASSGAKAWETNGIVVVYLGRKKRTAHRP
jgi:hypothetical protein